MTPQAALTCICLLLVLAGAIAYLHNRLRAAYRWDRLVAAAGGEREACREIEAIQAMREIRERVERKRRNRGNVLYFPPIVSQGREVRFTPDGAA